MAGAHAHSETRILIVEDEAIIARDLTLRLEGLGYQVTGTAATGEEALEMARSTVPNLVFMDIIIQGAMDGIEAARQLTSRMDVPIVFLTAHTDTGTIQRAKKARPYGYLIKPFDERELMTTIEMAVGRHKSDAAARLTELAMAGAGVGMILASAAGPAYPITVCNSAFERLSGYASADLVGRSPWFLDGGGPENGETAQLRSALEERKECQVSCRLQRKDGRFLRTNVVLSPVRSPFGETTHFLLCLSGTSPGSAAGGNGNGRPKES